jgi:membrane protease YdiL (CAAX protease family)
MAAADPVGRLSATLRQRPLASGGALVGSLAVLRAVDVLVFRLHVWLGTLAPSAVAMLLVGVVLARRTGGESPLGVALDRRALGVAVAVGVVGVGFVQVAARYLNVAALAAAGREAVLVVRLENPATTTTDPLQVGAYLLFAVLVTSVGEELLFRRVLLASLSRERGFWRANALQAALFGAWHFAWPLAYAVGPAEPYPPLWLYGGALLAVTGTTGLLYGWLAWRTGTVWTVVAAHLLHNLAAVVFHMRTASGDVRGSLVAAGVLVGYLLLGLACEWRLGERHEEAA